METNIKQARICDPCGSELTCACVQARVMEAEIMSIVETLENMPVSPALSPALSLNVIRSFSL